MNDLITDIKKLQEETLKNLKSSKSINTVRAYKSDFEDFGLFCVKNGFNNSIGWNLGKKNKSIHLLDPLTSIPIMGTKNNEIKEIKKSIIEYLNNWSALIDEKIKIIHIPIRI